MSNCVFCSIIEGKIKAEKLYEDDLMIIIKDIEPKAELHYLAIPKRHFKLLSEMTKDDKINLGEIFAKIAEKSVELGFTNGYRLIINQGDDAGQTVFHLHIHLLGGQKMEFPNF